jgi:hypothetical protein
MIATNTLMEQMVSAEIAHQDNFQMHPTELVFLHQLVDLTKSEETGIHATHADHVEQARL